MQTCDVKVVARLLLYGAGLNVTPCPLLSYPEDQSKEVFCLHFAYILLILYYFNSHNFLSHSIHKSCMYAELLKVCHHYFRVSSTLQVWVCIQCNRQNRFIHFHVSAHSSSISSGVSEPLHTRNKCCFDCAPNVCNARLPNRF